MSDEIVTAVGVSKPVAPAVKVYSAKVCVSCAKGFSPRSANQKRCDECIAKVDKKKEIREATQRSRARTKVKAQKSAQRFDSTVELSKKEFRAILENERGVKNQHVLDALVDLAEVAARHYKLPFNHYLAASGLRKTLESNQNRKQSDPLDIAEEEVVGEIVGRRELYALWDFSLWRQPDISFEDFLAQRRKGKSDAFWLGKEILGKDFEEQPHADWANFFPRLNPDGLRANYTQKEAQAWLGAQSDKKDRLFMASRNAFKSTFVRVWTLMLLLCLPDVRVLYVSGTRELMEDALRELRGYLQMTVEAPSRFAQLYPDYVIPVGEGSATSFSCPLAHLGLAQTTIKLSSLESVSTGSRFDVGVFDDLMNDKNTATEELRQKGIRTFDALLKLREIGANNAGASYVFTIGTPWAKGDLYQTLIERNEADPDNSLAVRIDPAWTVKPEARHKEVFELLEDDVTLLFPQRLTWKFLQSELRKSKGDNPPYSFFKTQNLCQWTEDETLTLHFNPDLLTRSVIQKGALPEGETVISVDIAYSLSARSDMTSIATCRLFTNSSGEKCLAVLGIDADRMKGSELAFKLVQLTRQYENQNLRTVLIEKGPSSDSLDTSIKDQGRKYSVSVPTYFVPVSNEKHRKFLAIKELEFLLAQGRLKFVSGPYIEGLFLELSRLDGTVSLKSKKDDRADSIAQVAKVFRITASARQPMANEDDDDALAQMRKQARMKMQYERIFNGGQPNTPPPAPVAPVESAPSAKGAWARLHRQQSEQLRQRYGR